MARHRLTEAVLVVWTKWLKVKSGTEMKWCGIWHLGSYCTGSAQLRIWKAITYSLQINMHSPVRLWMGKVRGSLRPVNVFRCNFELHQLVYNHQLEQAPMITSPGRELMEGISRFHIAPSGINWPKCLGWSWRVGFDNMDVPSGGGKRGAAWEGVK